MSFWTNFEGFFTQAEKAITTVAPEVSALETVAEEGANVVAALDPAAAAPIAIAEKAAASIAAVEPAAVASVNTLIADGRAAVANVGAPLESIWQSFENLWHATPAPGGAILLTPKTTSATVPAATVAALAPTPGAAT